MSLYLPVANEPTTDPTLQRLRMFGKERQTGIVGVALTLAEEPVAEEHLLLFKNGLLLDGGGGAPAYTRAANVITLAAPAIAPDVFAAWYYWRPTL